MGLSTKSIVRFEKLESMIEDHVGRQKYALWSLDTENDSERLYESELFFGNKFSSRRDFVTLLRGKLITLFGEPSFKDPAKEQSFGYHIKATYGDQQLFFKIVDRKAEQILIYWDFSTYLNSDVRNKVKDQLFNLLLLSSPSDFEEEIILEDDYFLSYGCKGGKPWSDVEIPLKMEKFLFQSRMKGVHKKHGQLQMCMDRLVNSSIKNESIYFSSMVISK
ncbi:hypothetical protein [Xanthovirga aplysinae]|uniref:hypothetical protein n=1 Tax=Xanthovirga aplysinae TaxID=2529853 RepID=UPI0012BD194E|nr:hypothetical protein [Xanthovirga aplysinae]MTI30369.1 hypothetical protein [Xanthovirga aplysinae]